MRKPSGAGAGAGALARRAWRAAGWRAAGGTAAAFLAFALVLGAGRAYALPAEVKIGVISPRSGGRSASAGRAHEEAIRIAIEQLGSAITVGDRSIQLRPIYEDDRGSPEDAVAAAERLVREGVVAILGPVNSACTKAVIARGLEVPILSALSTAQDLTRPRDPWFFRVTVDDGARMHRFAQFLVDAEIMPGAHDVFLFEGDGYGQGLKDSLRSELHPDGHGFQETAWPAPGATGFGAEVVSSLPARPVRVFVLGTDERAVAIAADVERQFRIARPEGAIGFFLVGDPAGVFERAPEGAITIAEPIRERDPRRAAETVGNEAMRKRGHWSDAAFDTAYFVIPQALQTALSTVPPDADLKAVRLAVRDALDNETFDSLTPWKKIRFQDGSLQDPPTTPIFRVGRSFERLDPDRGARWVRLSVPQRVRWLESPVEIELEGHGFTDDPSVDVEVVDQTSSEIVERISLRMQDGRAALTLPPRALGKFSVRTKVPSDPYRPGFEVVWSLNYLLAILGALVGSLLAIAVHRQGGEPFPTGRVAMGVAMGFGLFAVSTIGQVVPELRSLPLPRFGGPAWLAAICSGALGGWAGPGLLGLLPSVPSKK